MSAIILIIGCGKESSDEPIESSNENPIVGKWQSTIADLTAQYSFKADDLYEVQWCYEHMPMTTQNGTFVISCASHIFKIADNTLSIFDYNSVSIDYLTCDNNFLQSSESKPIKSFADEYFAACQFKVSFLEGVKKGDITLEFFKKDDPLGNYFTRVYS